MLFRSMVRVSQTSPGIFTASENGIGDGAIRHADFSLVTASHPAVAGETILVYVTGLGTVTPAPSDGEAAPGTPLTTVDHTAYVGIDGVYVMPTFEGLAPGFAGLYQMNVVVPKTTNSGEVSLSIVVPGVAGAFSATIPVAGSSGSTASVEPMGRHTTPTAHR